MHTDRIAGASVVINTSREAVWNALTDPDAIKQYMFGTTVTTDWQEGSEIRWKGEWKGKPYEDKGTILAIVPLRRLVYSHFSPLSGQLDALENYHTVTIGLVPDGQRTEVTLTQDNNATEEAKAHSEENWVNMLTGLKRYVEARR